MLGVLAALAGATLASAAGWLGGHLTYGLGVGVDTNAFDSGPGEVRQGPASIPQPTYEVRGAGDDVEVRRQERRALRTNPV